AVILRSAHVEKSGQRTEAGRWPIGSATRGWRYEHAAKRRFLFLLRDGLASRIQSLGPIHGVNEWDGDDTLSVGAVHHDKISVAAGVREKFSRLAVNGSVNQDHIASHVPIVRIVLRLLEIP